LLVAAVGGLVFAQPASAHDHAVTATCTTLTVDISNYSESHNEMAVIIDGVEVDAQSFDESFYQTYTFADSTVAHSFALSVTAASPDEVSFVDNGTSTPCVVTPPPTTPPPTTPVTPPTTVPPTTPPTTMPVTTPPTSKPTTSKPTPSVSGVTSTPPTHHTPSPTHTLVPEPTTLPFTGSHDAGMIAAFGLLGILFGAGLLLATRRGRTDS
jgi:hypothetical protein